VDASAGSREVRNWVDARLSAIAGQTPQSPVCVTNLTTTAELLGGFSGNSPFAVREVTQICANNAYSPSNLLAAIASATHKKTPGKSQICPAFLNHLGRSVTSSG